MGTGAAVSTGDLITAAKMNLKLEDLTDVAQVEILDQSGAGTETLNLLVTENLSADRNLTLIVNDAARTIDLTGNLTLVADFITSGANSLTLTTTGATNVTLPTTGTLAILAANTFTAAQTFAGNVDTVINISSSPIIDIGADVFAGGTFIDIAYDTAEVLTSALIGVNIDFGTNLTSGGAGEGDIKAIHIDLGPLTLAGAFNGTVYGIHLEADPTLADENITGILLTMSGTFGSGTDIGISVTGDGQTVNIVNDGDLYMSLAKASSVDINFQGISPVIDIGADVFPTGTFIDIAYDTAEVLTSDLTGINIDFSANLTFIADGDVFAYRTILAALTQSSTATTLIYGFTLPTAGALVQDTAAGTLDWRGVNIQLPTITQTTGTVTAYGIRITEGTTNSGAAAGLYIDVDVAIDLVTLGNRIDLDADNDTSIRASADDVIMIEIGGTDLIQIILDADSGGAVGTIQSADAREMAFCVTNETLVIGTEGTMVAPYLSSTGDAGTDALFGDADGAFAFNRDSDGGPLLTLEARMNGAWVSVAVSGYIIQKELEYLDSASGKEYLTNPAQLNAARDKIDETICFICGEQMYPGQPGGIVMYPNAVVRNDDLHAIFGHAHPELEPEFISLKREVEELREIVENYVDPAGAMYPDDVRSQIKYRRELAETIPSAHRSGVA